MTASTPCQACGGQGGKNETTVGANGAQITTWRPCGTCHGRRTR